MFTPVTNDDYVQKIAEVKNGVLICHKKLCPHCKNMEKVLMKFADGRSGIVFYSLDSEENPEALQDLGVERVPTILVLRDGEVKAKTYGLMNPREFAAVYAKA